MELIAAGTQVRLARAVAFAHDGREVVVNDVEGREIDAGGGFGRFGNHEVNGRALRDRAGPLHVEIGFDSVTGIPGSGPFRMMLGALPASRT